MAARIVLLGATGQIGSEVAAALVRVRARPLLVGRSAQDLAALGVRLGHGLDTHVVDLAQPGALLGVVSAGDVVVDTAGPFADRGLAVAEAVIQQRATYLDCATEPAHVARLFEELDGPAAAAGVALLPSIGHRSVVGTLAACRALSGPGATSVDIGYLQSGEPWRSRSTGDRGSRTAAALTAQRMWRGGELVSGVFADRLATFSVDGVERAAVATGGAEHHTLPAGHPALRDVGVYAGWPAPAQLARPASAILRRLGGVPRLATAVRWTAVHPGADGTVAFGPSAAAAAMVVAVARDAAGAVLRTVRLGGPAPSTVTAALLAWAALQLAGAAPERSGVLGAVDAFGEAALTHACRELAGVGIDDGTR